MRKTKLIIGVLIGLLLAAVAVIALFFVNPAVFRNQLEAGATAVFGRQVQFDGPISLEQSLRPWIVIEDIAIGNPGWASGAHLATAEKLGVRVALLPLLRGDLRVLDVSLTGVGVIIEEGPDGADNYTFGDKGDREEPGVLPAIEQLTIRDAIINYRSADANTMRFEITEARLWNIPGKPERIEGKGSTKGMAFAIEFAADTAAELSGPQNPWSVKLNIQGSDLSLIIDGRMTKPFVWDHGDYHITINGKQADSLENLFGVEFPTTGPFELSSNVNVAGGFFKLTDLEGDIKDTALWRMIRIMQGSVSAGESGFVKASIEAELDSIPLSLSFEGSPRTTGKSGTTVWPIKFDASSPGAILKGDGSVVTSKNRRDLQIATRIKGDRLESFGSLVGVSLPRINRYVLSAHIYSGEGVHELRDLKVQMGENRITGGVRWEDKTPRPLLTGKLSSDSLKLAKLLNTTPKLLSKTGKAEVFDRPIRLDWLKDIDAKLEFNVKSVTDSPISVENIRSAVTLSNGKLSAPFRGNLAGASVDGQIHLIQPNNLIGISLKAKLGRIDVGQALKQLELSDKIAGTADAVVLEGSSQGETLDALLKQATITLRIKPANLSLTGQAVSRAIDFKFDSAEFFTQKDRPVTAVFTGILQKDPFKATVSATNLVERLRMDVPLQLRVALQREDVQLNAEVTILRPFENMEFDLKHELTGKEIEGLSPLFDFAVPLQGEFQATGLLKARGNKFTYEEDLQVGQSDLKLFLTVLRKPTRPEITGRILAKELHIDNMRLFYVDKNSRATENGSRVIPDYTIPIGALLAADLDLDIKAERIRTQLGDLGGFVSKVRLKEGWFKSSTNISGFMGARISKEFDLNAAVKPPLIKIQLNAKDLNFGLLLSKMDVTDLFEGKIDLLVDLSGSGATRYSFLGNAAGRITIIGGPGQITGRRIDLWAADLIPTMLSSRWQREDVAEMNCMVAHIELKEGFAEIEDLLLDTQRITIASSGILNLETEALDLVIVPKPKRASLISLAKPVKITGTLSEPKVSAAKIPRKGQLAATGALAALINPVFLIFAFSDIGTGEANPCESAVERAYKAYEADLQ
ncbi:MAG: AsmA family protein [Deltaproteobacteria bacterium]|nr:AsmA family protein [Deltaproteobacteria bacterium]